MCYETPMAQNIYEQRVQEAGYPWTSTVTLNPYNSGWTAAIADRLNPHSHHAKNTHLIIQGELTIREQNTGKPPVTIMEPGPMDKKECKVERLTLYAGTPGNQGAQFVEGHSLLSPTTGRRFEARSHLFWKERRDCLRAHAGQIRPHTRDEWCAEYRAYMRGRTRTHVVNIAGLYAQQNYGNQGQY